MGKVDRRILTTEKYKSIILWLLLAFVVLFLFIAPFSKALFDGGTWEFEGPIYTAILWSSIALLVLSVYLIITRTESAQMDILSIIIWLIPLGYLISVLNAASNHLAMNSVYTQAMYAIFFIIGMYLTRSKLGLNIIIYAIVTSGYMLVIYGLMNWFGNAYTQDAIFGGRMANVFQYPNSYAALLIGLGFSSLLLICVSGKWYLTLLHSFFHIPIMLSLLLTSSRGAFLVFPVMLVIFLLLLPLARQVIILICLSISGIASLLMVNYITNLNLQLEERFDKSISFKGWLIVIAASLLFSLLVHLLRKYLEVWLENKWPSAKTIQLKNCIIPTGLIVIALIGAIIILSNSAITDRLPETIKQRVDSLISGDSSFSSRSDYYSDSMEVIKDYPVFGAGGGAWTKLYQVYQGYAYTSRQAHNFFLQYTLESGIVGIIIFLSLLFYLLITFVRYFFKQTREIFQYERLIFVVILCSILIHSTMDFDMTYQYLGTLVFLCLGGMSSYPSTSDTSQASKWMKRWKRIVPISLAIISIFMIIAAFRAYQGNRMFLAAIKESQESVDYDQITKKIDKTLRYQPNHPEYVLAKANLLNTAYTQTRDEKYFNDAMERLNRLAKREPYDLKVINVTFSLFIAKGELEQAGELISSKISTFPWEIYLYEKLIYVNFEQGERAKQQGLEKESEEYWDRSLSIYNEVVKKREWINTLTEAQQYDSYNFQVTPQMNFNIGQIYYLKGDYVKASSVLLAGRVSNDFTVPLHKEIARWYLASLQKQQLEDKGLYDLLIIQDETEAEKLQALLSS